MVEKPEEVQALAVRATGLGRRTMAERAPSSSKRYAGKYVATASFNSKKVVTYGKDARQVFKRAEKKGVKSPVVFFVPDENAVNIF